MIRVILLSVVMCCVFNEVIRAAEFEDDQFVRVLTNRVDDRPVEISAIEELAGKGEVGASTKTALGTAGIQKAYDWIIGKLETDLAQSIKLARADVARLDPGKPDHLKKLGAYSRSVKEVRLAIVTIENDLHKNADKLLTTAAVIEGTSMSSFAELWFKKLPAARKSILLLDAELDAKLKKKTSQDDSVAESFKLTKPPPSIQWAWDKTKEYQGYIDAKKNDRREEAKVLLKWSAEVTGNLPAEKDRNAFEEAVYGAYQTLQNTLKNYVGQ